jgi:UDP-2,3-diacylglucosamine pyrophosphatase LpxH
MLSQSTNLLIFSVFQSSKPMLENLYAHDKVKQSLKKSGINYIPCVGQYQGNTELSFIVSIENQTLVQDLCKQYNQESYLIHHGDRFCELMCSDGKTKPIGYMKEVTEAQAKTLEAWTKTPDDRYFICE